MIHTNEQLNAHTIFVLTLYTAPINTNRPQTKAVTKRFTFSDSCPIRSCTVRTKQLTLFWVGSVPLPTFIALTPTLSVVGCALVRYQYDNEFSFKIS